MLSQGTAAHKIKLRDSNGGRRLIGAIAIAVAAFTLIVLTVQPNPFASHRTYWAELDNVKGLGRIDRDIRIAGVNEGTVGGVQRVGDNALIELNLDTDIPIHEDAHLALRPHTLFEGSAFVDLSPGSPSAPMLDEGGTIPLNQTEVYVSLDEATRLFRKPIRDGLRSLLQTAAKTLHGQAISGTQQVLTAAPDLTRELALTARALQGPHRDELSGAISGLAATTRGVAAREASIGPLLSSADRTLTALEVDGAQPLDTGLAELPRTLARLGPASESLGALIDRLSQLAAEVTPALDDLTPAAHDLTPLLTESIPIDNRLAPMLSQLRTVFANTADAGPATVKVIDSLIPAERELNNSLLPFQLAPTTLGEPQYVQLLSVFASAAGAARLFQTPAQNGTGSGHAIALGSYGDSGALSGLRPACSTIAAINQAAADALATQGLCIP